MLILTCLLVSISVAGMAQDPVFSHFYSSGIQLNPAWAGVEGPAKIMIGYRNQWPEAGTSFITYQASYDQYIDKLHGGIGIRVLNDQQGGTLFNTYDLAAMYSYHFRVSRWLNFTGGIQAGVGQQSFNPGDGLVFGSMIDPVTGNYTGNGEIIQEYAEIYPDFATGMTVFYKRIYGGIAVHHLLNPVITDKNDPSGYIPRKYTAHFGALIPVIKRDIGREILQLSPNFVFMQQQNIQQINYGLEVVYKDIMLGIWARHDILFNYGNIIFTAGYGTDHFRFRYSYDASISSPTINLPNMGAHEFSLLIIYENTIKRKKHSAIKCPKF